jgi:hypothetical protein
MGNSSSISNEPAASITEELREVLFGDEPLEKVASYALDLEDEGPWAWFTTAARQSVEGDTADAIATFQRVLQQSGLEVRLYLQAWHGLRSMGIFPPEDLAREIQGMVVEVAHGRGLDIVAVYADGSARYINYSGAAIVWDVHDPEIDQLIAELLSVGQGIVDVSEPWDGPRPPAPSTGVVRINLLTFGGLHLGQGSFQSVSQDGLGGLALRGAFDLMQALIKKVKAKHQETKE